jgi:hypothetical protein
MSGPPRTTFAILQRAALTVGSVVVALALAELLAYVFATFVLVDGRLALLGDRFARGARFTADEIDGVPIWYQEMDDRPSPKPHKEGTRIVVLGDSVLLPAGLPEREGAIRRLEHMLGTALDGGPYEVINLAEAGWSTPQEEVRLRHAGLPLQPDLVVVGLSPNDNEQYVMVDGQIVFTRFVQDADARGGHLLARRSYAWNLAWLAERAIEARFEPLQSRPKGDSVLASLSRMAAMTRAAGSRFAILCFPYLDEQGDPCTGAYGWGEVVAWAEQEHIPLLVTSKLYARYAPPTLRLDPIHLSAFGHRVLATGWLRWLVDEHLVPGRAVHALPDAPPIPPPAETG